MIDLLVLAIAPAIFIFLYIYAKDRYEPENLHLVFWIFLLGALSIIPAALIEMPFPDGVFTSAVVAPVVEEGLKFLVVFLFVYRNVEFDEPVDGIIYAMAAALGFATIENILYVLEGGIAVGILRAIVSVPGHVIFSCIWGAALGIAKFRPEQSRTGIILAGLFGAMLLHGIFNFSVEILEIYGFLLILFVIIPLGWWMTSRNIRCAHDDPASWCSAMQRGEAAVAGAPGMAGPGVTSLPPLNGAGMTGAGNAPENPAPADRFCTQCGAELPEGIRFCNNCGRQNTK
jgi:RsiW-degrading membrane proteinase PrsW (M82 family)